MSVTITICTKCGSPCSRAWYDDCDLVPYGDRLVPMHQAHEGSNCCHAPCTERTPAYDSWSYTFEGREYRADEAADRRRERRLTEGF